MKSTDKSFLADALMIVHCQNFNKNICSKSNLCFLPQRLSRGLESGDCEKQEGWTQKLKDLFSNIMKFWLLYNTAGLIKFYF